MRLTQSTLIGAVCVLVCSVQASAIDVVIDYTFDTTNFFGAGNPDGVVAGQQARDALDTAAVYFSDITNDSFTGISTPAPFFSQSFNGQVTWEWTSSFTHPATGVNTTLTDQTILPDQYLVYAGARSLGGSTLGEGGPGGWGWSSSPSGGFTQGEIDQINQITADFSSDVETRGQATGFANWGGAITFDTPNTWHFDRNTAPGAGQSDFFSVAIHELAHALGFGSSSEWNALVSGSVFTGAASTAEFGSNPSVSIDQAHWLENTTSTVFGGATSQETAMDPDITDGDRKLFTTLDAAGLTDIGWDLTPPVITLVGDLDGDGFVGITDLNLVLSNWNQTVPPGNPLADPSGDGFVGLVDLNTVLGNWNAGTPPTQGTAVPEPMTMMWMGLSVPALLRRRG